MEAILSTDQVQYLDILRFPNLSIPENQTTFLVGKSGVGKSTLLKLFNATLSPSQGTVYYQGNAIAELDPIQLRREVLLAGQMVYLFDDTIAENFRRFFAYREEPCIRETEMETCLRLCDLCMPLTADCQTLSGGERQRVFLAIHIAMRPKVLMLDEPTSALDTQTAHTVLQNLKEYGAEQSMTILIISHDQALAQQYADNTVVLDKENAYECNC